MQASLTFKTDYCGVDVQIECTVDGSRTRRDWWDDLTVVDVESVTIGTVNFAPVEDSGALKHWKKVAQDSIDAVDELAVRACERLQAAFYEERGL